MSIVAPIILLPTNGADYATDVETQTLSGTTSTDTKEILVNGSTFGVSYTPGEPVWSWTGTIMLGTNVITIVAIEAISGNSSLPTTIRITLLQSQNFITVSPPTGVQVLRSQNSMTIQNVKNPEPQTIGYNYYVSTQSGGINNAYVKINTSVVNNYSFFQDVATPISTSTDTVGNIRVTTTTEEIERVFYYSQIFDQAAFTAMVTANLLPAVTFSQDTPFFFVVSAVIYDPVLGQVSESAFSSELQSAPLTIITGIVDLPARTQQDIILTFSQELLISNSGINTIAGTVIRDIEDPISEEMARAYIIQDFLSKANSVSTLQDFDDANGDGVSDPVSSSIPKQALKIALNLTADSDVQQIIDDQFDKLGSNVNVIRRGATAAIGQVIFFTETPPVRDMTVNAGAVVSSQGNLDQGIAAQSYNVLETKTLTAAGASQFFNPVSGQYELTLDIQAITPGSAGNTDSFTIVTISSGADSDFRVENPNPIAFGQDIESNHFLGTRIELAFFADTGTKGGYTRTAISVPGVQRVNVQAAGDPLMIRDYDPVRNEHIGGKVDIYIQGNRVKQVTDQIAFSFESIAQSQGGLTGENFLVINAKAFQFRSQNPRVGAHTPIFQVTRIFNATRSATYDITGYQIIGDGDTIDLNETLPINVTIGLASNDIIQVDYKFRSSDTFVLQHQPVLSVASVVGQISGPLTPDNYDLVRLEDPLAEGDSTIANDGVRIKFANNLPLTAFQTITDESHVLILSKQEPLNFLGADPESLVVKSQDHAITYQSNVDYRVIPGTSTVPTAILIIDTGSLQDGQVVLISYTAIENFIITYTINDLLNTVQTVENELKHACADVIVKQAIQNNVDFSFTVIPKTGGTTSGVTNTAQLTSQIQTAISNYITQLSIGTSLTQSEIIKIIQSLTEVSYVVVPFARMVKADGSFIIRDNIGQAQFEIYNVGLSTAYISVDSVLTYGTVDQGGSVDNFRGIFENTLPLVLQTDPIEVSGGPGRGYIQADGRIIVSTRDGLLPDTKNYQVAYYVFGEKGAKDINVASVEYLNVGTLTVNYDLP
jgi:uncharacterized phage protein gp47/JayE